MNSLENGDLFYSEGKIEQQRNIIGTIYPQKLEIEKGTYRTPKVNEGASIICLINSGLEENKNGTEYDFTRLSHWVTWERIELSTH